MTEQQIDRDALRKLAGAATPGPWEYEWDEDEGEIAVRAGTARLGEDGSAPGSYVTTDMILEREDAWPEDSGEQHAADAEFIAAARTAVPHLLDQLDAAEQRIRDRTQEVKDERGAALDQMEQVRIRDALIDQMTASEKFFSRLTEAEARIAAVDAELLYAELHGNLEVWTANIRRALER